MIIVLVIKLIVRYYTYMLGSMNIELVFEIMTRHFCHARILVIEIIPTLFRRDTATKKALGYMIQ